jgi:hypothetical protein
LVKSFGNKIPAAKSHILTARSIALPYQQKRHPSNGECRFYYLKKQLVPDKPVLKAL